MDKGVDFVHYSRALSKFGSSIGAWYNFADTWDPNSVQLFGKKVLFSFSSDKVMSPSLSLP